MADFHRRNIDRVDSSKIIEAAHEAKENRLEEAIKEAIENAQLESESSNVENVDQEYFEHLLARHMNSPTNQIPPQLMQMQMQMLMQMQIPSERFSKKNRSDKSLELDESVKKVTLE
jgi:hypothetical protein